MAAHLIAIVSTLLTIALAAGTAHAQTMVPDIVVGPVPWRAGARADGDPLLCPDVGFQCTPDCKSFMICPTKDKEPERITQCEPNVPFCTKIGCAAQPDPEQQCTAEPPQTDAIFACTSAGVFPDPHSCTQFYSCTAAAPAQALLHRCPAGSSYDAVVQSCMTGVTGRTFRKATCTTTMCPRKFVGYVAYAPNPLLYVFCFEEMRMVFRCPDAQNQTYDAKRKECVFKCTAAGHFVDRQDCKSFYTCAKRGAKAVRNTCPTGFAFVTGRCEREGATPCVSELR